MCPDIALQQKKIIETILFLYNDKSQASSNLNSKLLRFHCAHTNLHTLVLSSTVNNTQD